MKLFGSLFIFFIFSSSIFAQNAITLSGKIVDSADSSAISTAGVRLLAKTDSAFIKGVVSDNNGRFSLPELNAGNFILQIDYLGYQTLFRNVSLSDDKPQNNVGTLYLQTNDILLKEAVVEGKVPEVIVKNDTLEFDARSVKTTENAVVEDILKKLPGVEVATDGTITVNGKEVKKIKVDGKEFFSDDPKIASKNLPAEMVDKLQVVDQKSDMARMTGFDDGDEETIINLTVKAGMKKGTMGNFLVGGGKDVSIDNDARYQVGGFLNNMTNNDRYTFILQANNNNNMGAADIGTNVFGDMRMRRGEQQGGVIKSINPMLSISKEFSPKLTITGDFRFNDRKQFVDNETEQLRLSQVTSILENKQSQTNYLSDNFGSNLFIEWKPDSANTLEARPYLFYNSSSSTQTEFSQQYKYNTGDTITDAESFAKTRGKGINFGTSIDYSHRFAKPGRVLSIETRFGLNTSNSTENVTSDTRRFTTGLFTHNVLLDQQTENDNRAGTYRASVSWVEPLGNNNFLQLLYRINGSESKNLNSTYELENNRTTAVLLDSLSRSTVRSSIEHRVGLNFKAVRQKYNYTVGVNLDPTSSTNNTYQPLDPYQTAYDENVRLTNVRGDSLFSTIEQNVFNISPNAIFNYNFDTRSNLRVNYEGRTSQPTGTQLRDYIDKSRPYEWTQGNPALKPGYTNNLRGRFQKYVAATQLSYNINVFGNYSVNDIASVTRMQGDSVRITSYENISGNWNLNMFGMFSLPLKNKKFSIRNMFGPRLVNQNTFVDGLKNTQRTFAFRDNAGIDYRSDLFDVGASLNADFNRITHTIQPENNKTTMNYGIGGTTAWYLPHNFTVESDITHTRRRGYESYNISETMWNAAVTKQVFNKKAGTGLIKLQIYDILKNRSSITSQATIDGYSISRVNVIPSYFMCSFIFKFTAFPASSSVTEQELRDNNGQRPPWGGGAPPSGGGGGGGRPPMF